MAKRIYSESVKKWARNLGISGFTLIGLTFMYLMAVGTISNVEYSGDSICAGTIEDPCYAYINFTAEEDIFIYPFEGTPDPWGRDTLFNFDPNVKSWKLERSWGKGWWEYNLSEPCATGNPRCGAKKTGEPSYALAWRDGKDYEIRITAYKNSPYDEIKWGAFSGVDEIDPTWLGIEKEKSKEEIIYTKSSDKICKDGKCNLILYSGIRNVQEDDKWKRVENARSLKNKGFDVIINSDGVHNVEVLDFNMTFIEFDLSFDENNLGEYEYGVEDGKMKTKYKIKFNETYEEEFEIEIEEEKKENIKYYGNPFGKEFHLGENSTTIQLQEADTENVADVTARKATGGVFPNWVQMRWNISSLYDLGSISIEDATFCGFIHQNFGSPLSELESINLSRITNQTWTESISVAGFIANTLDTNSLVTLNSTDEDTWGCFDTLSVINADFSETNNFSSIRFAAQDHREVLTDIGLIEDINELGIGEIGNGPDLFFRSKESTPTSERPILSITFVLEADPPTFSDNAHNNTLVGLLTEFSILWDDDTALNPAGQYIFSTNNTGVWVNDSAVNFTATPSSANVTKVLNSTPGETIGYRWYATDNSGKDNITEIFTLTTTAPPVFSLDITDPTTSDPESVNSGDNITITFDFQEDGVNQTSLVTMNNVTIGGEFATIIEGGEEESVWEFIGMVNDSVPVVTVKEIDLPIGTDTNHIVIIAGAQDYNVDDCRINTAGYTFIHDGSGAVPSDFVSYKVMGETPDTLVEIETLDAGSNDRPCAITIQTWSGVNITDPIDVTRTLASGSSGMPNSPAYEPDFNGALIFSVGMLDDDNPVDVTAPSGFSTLSFSNDGAAPNGATVMMASLVQETAASVNPTAFGGSGNDEWEAITFALRISGGGAPSQEFDFVSGVGWQVNVTVPTFASGLKNLFLNATFSGNTRNDTQTNAINYGGVDTCTCAGLNNNWEVSMADFCIITEDCDLGIGKLSFIDSGNFTCDAQIDTTNMGDPGSGNIFWVNDECRGFIDT
jgi:hypothetical protein